MSTTTARCDRIIALIDECLAEHDSRLQSIAGDALVGTPRTPSGRLHPVRSAR
jgi:hypothetical protein